MFSKGFYVLSAEAVQIQLYCAIREFVVEDEKQDISLLWPNAYLMHKLSVKNDIRKVLEHV